MPNTPQTNAVIMAGIPERDNTLFWKIRFSVGDPVAWIELPESPAGQRSTLILRDIEMSRARQHARVDQVACPADFTPEGGLSGDRETATAQAAAECLRRAGVQRVTANRTLPLIYAEMMIRRAGIEIECDTEMGIVGRRQKDEQEIELIRQSQQVTEEVMLMACELIARADARADGVLLHNGEPLMAEQLRAMIDHWLLDRSFSNVSAIVACGSEAADCHNLGSGPIGTGQPVIVDIFPCSKETRYCGDCTRTVVHGDIPDEIAKMHIAVREAKEAATAAARVGVTGEVVHLATLDAIRRNGYEVGLPPENAPPSFCTIPHGTGHGVGLDVHEPPLLDMKGPELLLGDVVTIEPGLYRADIGGVRIEDIVAITETGAVSLNRLPDGLDWK